MISVAEALDHLFALTAPLVEDQAGRSLARRLCGVLTAVAPFTGQRSTLTGAQPRGDQGHEADLGQQGPRAAVAGHRQLLPAGGSVAVTVRTRGAWTVPG